MAVNKQYIKEIKKRFGGYNATWLPGSHLSLGDIGVFDHDGGFNKKGNLKDLDIDFQISQESATGQLEYSSERGSTTTQKLAGTVLPSSGLGNADAGVIVNFSKKNAVVLKAKDVTFPSISNKIQLEADIIKLYHQQKWKKEWCVVTELAKAESATILISNSANSEIVLKANANINAPKIDIADASFHFSCIHEKEVGLKIIAEGGLTPLFKAQKMNLKKGDLQQCLANQTSNVNTPALNATVDMEFIDFVFSDENTQMA